MKNRTSASAALTMIAALFLASCASSEEAPPVEESAIGTTAESEMLASWDLDGLDATQIITQLDEAPVAERPEGLIASVEPDELVVTDGSGVETRLPLPEDEMYVAVAPFRERTHECYFHSLTTCLGELGDADVQVKFETDEGEVLLDEARRTYDNGFVGLWLPRGVEGVLTIEQDGDVGSVDIATNSADDPTCITGLQLS
ncbi:CueP family metal-binding protein [Microbacterium suaedae]|uniref:CueP family metal-binding protein n=1 Tax=Microbacterium suaedae TaxID=2067813 RepID=UPI000DA21855|nr:CueP family metal-binding protein [Microbacterium suaedae]